MAKAKYGGGILDLRGSIGGQVHSRNTYGAYVRQKVSPVQPRTARQQEARQMFAELSRIYSAQLTDEQQEAWRQAAASSTVRDVFGDSITLTGINLFCQVNSIRAWQDLPPLLTPPAITEVPALTSAALSFSGGALTLTVAPDPVPTGYSLAVYATEPVNPGVAFAASKLRLLKVIPAGTTGPHDLTAAYASRFGGVQPGRRIYVQARLWSQDGLQGPPTLTNTRT